MKKMLEKRKIRGILSIENHSASFSIRSDLSPNFRSSFASKRLMFSRCLKRIKIPASKPPTINGIHVIMGNFIMKNVSRKIKIGSVGVVTMFAKEVYLVVNTTVNHTIANPAAVTGTKHMNTPAVVAIPFPPLNRNHTG